MKNEGPKEMTLDEWKAMQDKERTKVEFNIRKPNEGADSQWKKGYVLHKSKSEDVSESRSRFTRGSRPLRETLQSPPVRHALCALLQTGIQANMLTS